MSPFIYYY